jgi:hypothetical protein
MLLNRHIAPIHVDRDVIGRLRRSPAYDRCMMPSDDPDMAMERSVAIIGLGPRGLSVLERIITLSNRTAPRAGGVRVEVIDPTCSGPGIHSTQRPWACPGSPDIQDMGVTPGGCSTDGAGDAAETTE